MTISSHAHNHFSLEDFHKNRLKLMRSFLTAYIPLSHNAEYRPLISKSHVHSIGHFLMLLVWGNMNKAINAILNESLIIFLFVFDIIIIIIIMIIIVIVTYICMKIKNKKKKKKRVLMAMAHITNS